MQYADAISNIKHQQYRNGMFLQLLHEAIAMHLLLSSTIFLEKNVK